MNEAEESAEQIGDDSKKDANFDDTPVEEPSKKKDA
jgi:hypothetical protein